MRDMKIAICNKCNVNCCKESFYLLFIPYIPLNMGVAIVMLAQMFLVPPIYAMYKFIVSHHSWFFFFALNAQKSVILTDSRFA